LEVTDAVAVCIHIGANGKAIDDGILIPEVVDHQIDFGRAITIGVQLAARRLVPTIAAANRRICDEVSIEVRFDDGNRDIFWRSARRRPAPTPIDPPGAGSG
jgi:hypothetical protein